MTSSTRTNKEVVRRSWRALDEGDRKTFERTLAEDVVHHLPTGDDRGRKEYADAIFSVFRLYAETNVELKTLVGEDEYVAVRAIFRATTEEGRKGNVTIIEIHRVADGHIVETWGQVDRATMWRHRGVITDVAVRNQYLEVLNRVLRHNLRNGLDSILGYAETVTDGETDLSTAVDSIKETAAQLVSTAEKARTLQAHAVDRTLTPEETDVVAALQTSIENARTLDPTATITLSEPPPSLPVVTDRVLLDIILAELLENAVVHNDAADPRVEVSVSMVESDTGTVTVEIADNGSGIPEHERRPLVEESEDPLMHGSGIGLWAVKWSVERLDGDLTFSGGDGRGGVVSVTLPDLNPAD